MPYLKITWIPAFAGVKKKRNEKESRFPMMGSWEKEKGS
jgi:hypothetical protein